MIIIIWQCCLQSVNRFASTSRCFFIFRLKSDKQGGQPYVPQALCSSPYDISPYVSHVPQCLCSPEMFRSPVAPQTYIITQSLFSPSTYVSPNLQSLCSPVPMFVCLYIPTNIHPSPSSSYVPPKMPNEISTTTLNATKVRHNLHSWVTHFIPRIWKIGGYHSFLSKPPAARRDHVNAINQKPLVV